MEKISRRDFWGMSATTSSAVVLSSSLTPSSNARAETFGYNPACRWPFSGEREKANQTIALQPEFLVPGHGDPVHGKDTIKEVLGNYRDAILHIHQLALDAVKEFKPIDEVVSKATLPPPLAGLSYLEQSYGAVAYSVRSIYESYVGWFDGNPVNLSPLPRKALGAELLAVAGSAEKVLRRADLAQREGRHQVVLELCEMVLANDPKNRAARLMKIDALLAMSKLTANFPTAAYYDTFAQWEKLKLKEG